MEIPAIKLEIERSLNQLVVGALVNDLASARAELETLRAEIGEFRKMQGTTVTAPPKP